LFGNYSVIFKINARLVMPFIKALITAVIFLLISNAQASDGKKYFKVTGQIQMVENEPFAHPAVFVSGKALHIDADSITIKALVKLQGEKVTLFYTKKVKRLKDTYIKVVNYKHIIHK
jgi:hypothetical protein